MSSSSFFLLRSLHLLRLFSQYWRRQASPSLLHINYQIQMRTNRRTIYMLLVQVPTYWVPASLFRSLHVLRGFANLIHYETLDFCPLHIKTCSEFEHLNSNMPKWIMRHNFFFNKMQFRISITSTIDSVAIRYNCIFISLCLELNMDLLSAEKTATP